MQIAGNGTGDTQWKVPGVLDWSSMTHNRFVDVTRTQPRSMPVTATYSYFLVDDTNPIEAGRLPDGSPDVYFRGIYC
jgi:hypothetical protein